MRDQHKYSPHRWHTHTHLSADMAVASACDVRLCFHFSISARLRSASTGSTAGAAGSSLSWVSLSCCAFSPPTPSPPSSGGVCSSSANVWSTSCTGAGGDSAPELASWASLSPFFDPFLDRRRLNLPMVDTTQRAADPLLFVPSPRFVVTCLGVFLSFLKTMKKGR